MEAKEMSKLLIKNHGYMAKWIAEEILEEVTKNIRCDWLKYRTDETDYVVYWQSVISEIDFK